MAEKKSSSKAATKKVAAKKAVKKSSSKAVKKGGADEVTAFLDEANKQGVLDDVSKGISFISTGSWVIDRIIGDGTGTGSPGGIPRGCMTEIFGDESCGKTTLSLHVAKTVMNDGGRVLFVDFEHSLRAQKHYLKNMGVDIEDTSRFIYLRPDNYEQGALLCGKAVAKFQPDLIIIDSLAAAIPKAAGEGDAGDSIQIGLHAKLTSNFLNFMSKRLMNNDSALIILNQKRTNVKTNKYDPGPAEITTGGKAIKYYMHLRLEMKVTADREEIAGTSDLTGAAEKKRVNQTIKVTAIKNKLDIPWKSAPIYIRFGEGIDGLRSKIELAISKKVIKKGGAWFEYVDPEDSTFNFKANGMNMLYKKLIGSPEIVERINPRIMPSVDAEEIQEYKEKGLGDDELDFGDDADLAELGESMGLSGEDLELDISGLDD
jgi:recombination protein RecA